MKKLIIGIVIGLFINGIVCYAENVIANPFKNIAGQGYLSVHTTKVTTPEGNYRIFVTWTGNGVGMTAIKIN